MFRLIDSEVFDLPPVQDVDVLVVLGDRRHPDAAPLIPRDRSRFVSRFFLSVAWRARRFLVPIADEQGVIEAAARLGALPDEIIEPGAVVEVHALLERSLARRAQEAAQAAALAATAAEGHA